MKFNKLKGIALIGVLVMTSCNRFIDVVPDNVPTLEYAFRMRSTAIGYLATCYSFLPSLGNYQTNPGLLGGDEMWATDNREWPNFMIARGEQNINNPYLDSWNGANSATAMWMGISQCNIFLEHISSVPDMEKSEIDQWIAEVKTLKAYYHFYLLRTYGPIPIMRENLPISASGDEVRVVRRPVDEVFAYIVELLDEAIVHLPDNVLDENSEMGRITLPIAMGLKAKVLVYAASPLFNGNTDYSNFTNKDQTPLFDQTYRPEKWERAVIALKEAIEYAHILGYELHEFQPNFQARNISDTTKLQMNYRGTVTERWNPEILWANTNSTTRNLQLAMTPRALNSSMVDYQLPYGTVGVTLKVASLFYTSNGVPIEEDLTWNYNDRFQLKTATENEKYKIKEGYVTARFNFDRESRFYGGLGFDGGIWYGHGRFDDNDTYWYEGKVGQYGGKVGIGFHSVTGYYAKKLSNYANTPVNRNSYTTTNYPWVMLRLGDLYLLYAEAYNELYGPEEEAYHYLNLIRAKAGLPTVQEAWTNFSINPNKYTTKEGLREIIHQERAIELAMEGERFWDLRRWKTAPVELNGPISGWDVDQETAGGYYRERIIFHQSFALKDYFWPLRERDLIVNKNLVQNPGW
ncbi:Starch-binding associating with outer membrane [Parapedobacter composti]|uniref:Starch-binding associating with outer membrane n=1 Tax=Parapedobacter composti TaxID=623281 RepID=A0A1I1E6L5_9SPHI|nr:RagB/SusD family nutrient uptake outer membrane protein [Parapedobacter composti]SFB82296.1 Starch-binding associating with outer membrane [Parapedobacter composti]